MPNRGSQRLWIRTLDKITITDLAKPVVIITSGPPPEATQDRTQTKDTPNYRIENKMPDPTRNSTWTTGLEGRNSTDHATVINELAFFGYNSRVIT